MSRIYMRYREDYFHWKVFENPGTEVNLWVSKNTFYFDYFDV